MKRTGDPRGDLTRNQALVFDALSDADEPLGAYSILDLLRDEGFRAPLQVYRALERLQKIGLVHRLESLNAFVACRHKHGESDGVIAFAICDACGRVEEFDDEEISRRLENWAGGHDFELRKTTIEINGLCVTCRAA